MQVKVTAMKFTIAVAGLLIFGCALQSKAQAVSDSVKIIARSHKDSVVLRWAPSSPAAWGLLNKHGYKVERYTVVRDGKVLQDKERTVLAEILKPAPQAQWERWIDRDDFVAVAAQSIFGETFQIDMKQADAMQIYNKVQEQESRYSFALYAADLSVQAATLSGIRFTDHTVKANEMYLYRVYSLVPENIRKIQFGFVYAGPKEAKALPVPRAPEIENVSESSVLLRWETNALRDIYVGYFLERSENDGITFKRLDKVPMSILQAKIGSDGMAYSAQRDTLVVGKKVLYRIYGVNSFGEVGPPSETLIFTGEAKFEFTPTIVKSDVIDNTKVRLTWEFPAGAPDLKGFEVERSNLVDKNYKAISPIVPAAPLEFIDQAPAATNYYRVVAVSSKGVRNASFPYLVQLVDSIPPLAPSGLKAAVDSTGMVTLSWANNKELDLLGYRVFRSSFKNAEFGQVTVSPLKTEGMKDTVNIKTLSSKMYYKIAAVDNRFNTSLFSDIVELELPDVIPPVPPVLTGVKAKEGGVDLTWRNSSSEDVVEHHIYRKHQYSGAWSLLKVIGAKDSCCHYFDKIDGDHQYQYALLAVDKSKLKSASTKPVTGKPLKNLRKPKVTGILAMADRVKKQVRLTWQYDAKDVTRFMIYRAAGTEPLSLYRTTNGPAKEYADTGVSMGESYTYRVKALFKDGTESVFF
jgi:fibronectin type 3 domain-containing protein